MKRTTLRTRRSSSVENLLGGKGVLGGKAVSSLDSGSHNDPRGVSERRLSSPSLGLLTCLKRSLLRSFAYLPVRWHAGCAKAY